MGSLFRSFSLCLLLAITSCSTSLDTALPSISPTSISPAVSPTPILFPSDTPAPTATPEPVDTGWRPFTDGVEWRRLWAGTDLGRERLTLVRIDPAQIRLRVIYQPTHPRRISEWADLLSETLLVVNAGYFSPEMQALGLLVSDGVASGSSYQDFAGMLAVNAPEQNQQKEKIQLRWLSAQPYNPNEPLIQAVQSFPVLVKPGGVMGFPPDADEGQRSRRTVVAQDSAGRILFLVSPLPQFSLHKLAVWLTESDLEIDIAMNLDGGTSTGLQLGDDFILVDSLVPIPAVIAIEPVNK